MVATIFLRIVLTRTIFHYMKCLFKNFNQGILFMHQLFQITCTARNRVINNKILLTIVCVRNRDFANSCPQMVNITKILIPNMNAATKDSIFTDEESIVVAGTSRRRISVVNSRYRNRHSS